MHRRTLGWLLPVLVLLLAPPLRAEEPAAAADTPYADPAILEQHLGPACDMVETLCEATFPERPAVRVSDAETVGGLIEAEFAVLPDAVFQGLPRDALAEALATALLAKYDPKANVIHVLPEVVASVNKEREETDRLGIDHLRLLLVHEATHALDFQRFPWTEERKKRKTNDEHLALNAVVEGHAQFVEREAARAWKLDAAFATLTEVTLGTDIEGTVLERAAHAALLSAQRFAYGQGQKFFEAVAARQGREGVLRALRQPPTSSAEIERPALWMDPALGAEAIDLERIVEAFRPIVAHEAWHAQKQRILKLALESQAVRVPEEHRATFLRGFQDAHMLLGTVPGEDVRVMCVAMSFDTEVNARQFLKHERILLGQSEGGQAAGISFETKELSEGLGRDRSLAGIYMHRLATVGERTVPVYQQVLHVGRVVCELLVINVKGVTRQRMDEVIEHVAAFVEDPEAAASREPPSPWPFEGEKRRVTITVVGPDGEPVPRARVVVLAGDEGPLPGPVATLMTECVEGRATLPGSRGEPLDVIALHARDAEGEPLPFAPSEVRTVEADATAIELRMPRGASIEGRVFDHEGRPVTEADVHADAEGDGPLRYFLGVPLAEATTDADGRFRLVGLPADRSCRLTVKVGGHEMPPSRKGVAAGARDVEIHLQDTVRATVVVVDPEGKPVEGAQVSVQGMGFPHGPGIPHGPGGAFVHQMEFTDSDGEATFGGLLSDGTYTLTVNVRTTWADLHHVSNHRRDDWSPSDTRIRLQRGWTLRGRLVDAEGKPTRGTIFLRTAGRGWSQSETEADGRFSLGSLPPGPATVATAPPGSGGYEEMLKHMLRWTEIEETEDAVELTRGDLDTSALLTVEVVGPDGTPVPRFDATFTAASPDETELWSSKTKPGHDGRVQFARLPSGGRIRIHAAHDDEDEDEDADFATAEAEVAPDQREVRIQLGPGRTLRGRVTSHEGEPVADVGLVLGKERGRWWWTGHTQRTRSDAEGRFAFRGLALGTRYYVDLQPPSQPWDMEPVEVAPDAEHLVIRLPRIAAIRVVDPSGEPVRGAFVSIRSKMPGHPRSTLNNVLRSATTDDQGRVRIQVDDEPERLVLRVEPPRSRHELLLLELHDWDARSGTLSFPASFVIEGVVQGRDGPLPGAVIEGRPRDSEEPMEWIAAAGPGGRFETKPVPEKPMMIRARVRAEDPHGDEATSPEVEVMPDDPRVVLEVPPRDASVTLALDGAKQGWSGWLVRRGGGRIAFDFEEDGRTTVASLLPGTYTVYVPHPEDPARCVHRRGVQAPGEPVTLAWTPAVRLVFRLQSPEPLQAPTAEVEGPAFESFEARPATDGTHVIAGLPPGTWTIRAFAQHARTGDWWHGTATSDGTRTVTIHMAPLHDED